ncbi:hypothetical protein ABT263_02705 [Kitasatospora sp. NPDC001603]|uniref:hypothetical protein n=1 Tax=Kitasatospora sp. NPDC001603 TaxID=3154388 RepID=UPI00332C532F
MDVREAAYAHLTAASLPEAEGRHLVVAETTDIVDLGRRLLPAHGAEPGLLRRAAPEPLAVALAPVIGLPREYVRRNIGFDLRSDRAKSRRAPDARYRPAQTSMEEMPGQLASSKAPKS